MKFTKIHKGDQVLITGGKDKGKQGKVEQVFPNEQKVLVAGVNMFKRHTKKKDEKTPAGIIEITKPMPLGKVALICPKCKKPTRVGFEIKSEDKYRVCKKCGQMIS